MKYVGQGLKIKILLAERGESITSMALKLGEPYGSVACNVNGHRSQPALQEKIAGFLGLSAEQLFGDNGSQAGTHAPLVGAV